MNLKKNLSVKNIVILAVLLLLPALLTAVGFSYGILVCCFSFLYPKFPKNYPSLPI